MQHRTNLDSTSFIATASDQARRIFDLILPNIEAIGDRTGGMTMQTPKGLAKALVARALQYPELHLQVRRYPQLPGTYGRSADVLFAVENTYKSLALMPWWFFGGFREVALGSMFYHEVISPFRLLESSRDFISPRAAQLTLEQRQLRRRQDEIRRALAVAVSHDSRWATLWTMNATVFRRLSEIRIEKRAEATRIEGSNARWRELGHGFQASVRPLGQRPDVPEMLKESLVFYQPDGKLSKQLVEYFDAKGRFFVAGGGPWITLPLAGGELASTGLSTAHILSGDPRLAALVLAAVIDYNLSHSPARREDIDYMEQIVALFRQATDAIGRQPAGE
jgi:hypothetical protein